MSTLHFIYIFKDVHMWQNVCIHTMELQAKDQIFYTNIFRH